MAPQRRGYAPKVKGCYQCSRRRINCDRTRPSCRKCLDRNISCSGIGIRYRFATDVLTRLKGHQRQISTAQHPVVNLGDEVSKISTVGNVAVNTYGGYLDARLESNDADLTRDEPPCPDIRCLSHDVLNEEAISNEKQVPAMNHRDAKWYNILNIAPGSSKPIEEHLLFYFSERIAPILVMVDDHSNGWRRLVLPIARADDLVKFALILASVSVIHGLRRRQNLEDEDLVGKQCIVLTLLILLVTAIVNGSSDFRDIFKILESSIEALSDEPNLYAGDLGIFIARQIPKFRGYASPFLSQNEAVTILSKTAAGRPSSSRGWDEFASYCNSYPDLGGYLSAIYKLNQKACSIYLARAQMEPTGPALNDLVEDFKTAMELFSTSYPVEHTLVWPCFIVALESSKPSHRQFFADALRKHQRRQGFANIAKGLDYLSDAWSTRSTFDWVRHLTKLNVFVM